MREEVSTASKAPPRDANARYGHEIDRYEAFTVPALPKEQRDELNLGLVARQKTGDRFALPLRVELLA
jgi:hypothetical protein